MSLQLLLHSHAAICHDASKLDSLSVLRESHSIARKSKQPEDFPVAGEVMGCRPYRQERGHALIHLLLSLVLHDLLTQMLQFRLLLGLR